MPTITIDGDDSLTINRDTDISRGSQEVTAEVEGGTPITIQTGCSYLETGPPGCEAAGNDEGSEGSGRAVGRKLFTVEEGEEQTVPSVDTCDRIPVRVTTRDGDGGPKPYRIGITMREGLSDLERETWQRSVQFLSTTSCEAIYVRRPRNGQRTSRSARRPQLDRTGADTTRYDAAPTRNGNSNRTRRGRGRQQG